MTVRYHTRQGRQWPEYVCQRESIQTATAKCQTIPGAGIDQAIGALLIETVTPLTLEVALQVQAELEARAADALRRQGVERARYEADLARRRFMEADPANRLVVDVLEADWNDKLRVLHDAQAEFEQRRAQTIKTSAKRNESRFWRWLPISRDCGTIRRRFNANASAWRACSSKTSR